MRPHSPECVEIFGTGCDKETLVISAGALVYGEDEISIVEFPVCASVEREDKLLSVVEFVAEIDDPSAQMKIYTIALRTRPFMITMSIK